MGATFSSAVEALGRKGAEVEVPRAAPGGDEKKLRNDLVDSYVIVDVDAAEVEVPQPPPGGDEKTSWPELVGCNEYDAAHAILQDRHDVHVDYYDYGENAPPPGFDPKRVVVFVDSRFRVVTVPKLG